MRRIHGACFVSLDGVMQAPGGPEEDWTGSFPYGGWLAPLFDQATGEAVDKVFAEPFDLLLGRRTYDIFSAFWPYAEGDHKPMGELFDRIGKYVVTHDDAPLDWQNSHRVGSIEALADIRGGDGPDLVIQGSSTLYPQLLAAGLLDRLTVMTFPVVLGTGKRLFGDGTPARMMTMVDHQVSPAGAVIAVYEPAGPVQTGSFAAPEPSERELERLRKLEREEGSPA
ncbi:dihydrofolate reductase family protein [Sphingomonas sp. GCM10030256]|uniref:dihydrofolate reductase family protein n=1 Tax=Sphingomonas sp. GCM10030256 TaxID=3273427 RepID=UPI00360EA064